ncbi:hypothetical protein FVEN_g12896 [Fusarium venenatum]|uniref:BTB domain-containing protein n=1 Tax=Fusarium venenatum TaxID=56646 RepID=A0A2L2TMN7_9HYPO|nr:uncharacterized protein FVRRES_02419 [Fusarium venenatum]KAG8354585.1 hypothetical protein FVEN_g12896 [Fusarium venenatum]CEI65907.1 unnamed protein product [Fusarium venenatum]
MSLTKDAGENLDEMLESTILQLASDWDTILVIPDDENEKPTLRCMVSSSILMNQMSYFRALFTSGSRGLASPKGEKPEISLLGDDPEAM